MATAEPTTGTGTAPVPDTTTLKLKEKGVELITHHQSSQSAKTTTAKKQRLRILM